MKKIIAINLGSTSTKIVYYEDDVCVFADELQHDILTIKKYNTVWQQKQFRMDAIIDFINKNDIEIENIDAFTSRGGHTIPIEGGVYEVTELMLEQSDSEIYGNHISDVGLQIASDLAKKYNTKAFTVDPPITDEFEPLAYYSGLPEIKRKSSMHALNHKAVARKYAIDNNTNYEDLNLVVVHLGGGVSVAAHKKGKMIDGHNALLGDGPFSTNRTGSLPVGDLIKMCYSGEYTYEQMKKKLNGEGGMVAYVGDNSVLNVYNKAMAGDTKCLEVLNAMVYQIAKEIGAYATVLKGQIDAIIMTGGIAKSEYIVNQISERVSYIAPISVYPGEFEMESLAKNSYKALIGEVKIKKVEDFI